MKKVPVVKITTPPPAPVLAGLPFEATVVLADVAAAMREGLLAFSAAAGLVVMRQMLDAELASIVGAKHAKLPDRVGNWHGTTTGQVVLGVGPCRWNDPAAAMSATTAVRLSWARGRRSRRMICCVRSSSNGCWPGSRLAVMSTWRNRSVR